MVGHAQGLESALRSAVLGLVRQDLPFTPVQIAELIEPNMEARRLQVVTRLLRELFDGGFFKGFGYRRTVTQETTPQGIITQVLYAPPSRILRANTSALGVRSEFYSQTPSERPTRSPITRPFAYLGLDRRATRRLIRQTRSLSTQIGKTGEQLMKTGELLMSIEAQLGEQRAAMYFERELSLSRQTARQMIRVAAVFGGHQQLQMLAVLRPSLLYKLAAPSLPVALRDALIQRGLMVDGARRRLSRLRVRDVAAVKRRWLTLARAQRDLSLTISQLAQRNPGSPRLTALHQLLEKLRSLPRDQIWNPRSHEAKEERALLLGVWPSGPKP